MPRRRPPLTAREIAAYLAGARMQRLWLDQAMGPVPTYQQIMNKFARGDAAMYVAMSPDRYWRMFWAGWDDQQAQGL